MAILKRRGENKKNLIDKKKEKVVNNKLFPLLASTLTVVFASFFVLSGYASYGVNVYPPISTGSKKTTTLRCEYAKKTISIDTEPLYQNIDNYYQYNSIKKGKMAKNDFSSFVYINQKDQTIKKLAEDIKRVGESNGLKDDQLLELATCLVQNIPYDQEKADKVLSNNVISEYDLSQFPYETIYKNKGICTDKTYLASAILREMGYGTGIFAFPNEKHMALAVNVPSGFTEFNSKYAIVEVTNTGFAPGVIPSEIDKNNGKPSLTINNLNELSVKDDPSKLNLNLDKRINAPTLVIDVNQGRPYTRIMTIKNLENKILSEANILSSKKDTLELAFNELKRREGVQQSAYSSYLMTPSTRTECGYKYDFTSSYSYNSYLYSSPYKYSCEQVANQQKNFAYSNYSTLYQNYTNQVNHYNKLISDFNNSFNQFQSDINIYKTYQYN